MEGVLDEEFLGELMKDFDIKKEEFDKLQKKDEEKKD